MATQSIFRSRILTFLVAVIGTLALPALAQTNKEGASKETKSSIRITRVPPRGGGPDRMEPIAGTVSGMDVKDCRVVIFALGGGTWYVQPYVDSPYTEIGDDGQWENDTHLGSRYAALLVKRSYRSPATTRTLPAVGGEILAITSIAAAE